MTKEEFLKIYDELTALKKEENEELRTNAASIDNNRREKITELSKKLETYGKDLVKQNPNDKEIACIVYSAIELQAPRIYELLSEDLRNDKLVTMLALSKFDNSAYGRIGEKLKDDKEVMYLLTKQTAGLLSITQFSPNLLSNQAFWKELFESRDNCLASESGNNYKQVLYLIEKYNTEYNLNIDTKMVQEQFNLALKNPARTSSLDVFGLYNSYWKDNPHVVQEIINGNTEIINKHIADSNLKETLLPQKSKEERYLEQYTELKEKADTNGKELTDKQKELLEMYQQYLDRMEYESKFKKRN